MPVIEEVPDDEPTAGPSTSGNDGPGTSSEDTAPPQPPAGYNWQALTVYISNNKINTSLWLSRWFTVACCIVFIIPIFGSGYAYAAYQRALISNGLTSALRLHQRLPRIQLTREFFGMMLLEDSCHYLLYSLLFANSHPITLVLTPVMLYALLYAMNYTRTLLNMLNPNALPGVHNLINKLAAKQQQIFRFIALNEIILMPCIIFMIFTGRCSLILPFIYYRFLTFRYTSRRNAYCRTMFYEMRVVAENYSRQPNCPGFVSNIITKSIMFLNRLAPPTATAPQQQS
ncbi:transmembrane protein 33-like [Saccoglossus kowalevskii]|uniref:Transmembrane protein 33-like n=1 Tax=Saccoglossus kowalevskii TaxID=10224 RepID=A0ABM0MXY3_SACKO|nr:PREDICTED: transmembrane protein 33-like [Saccoglossus kowalevskii]